MKIAEENTYKWKGILNSRIGRFNIVKMSVLPKAIYRLSASPFKIPVAVFFFFFRSRKIIPKMYMKPQNSPNSQRNPEE